ncbi:MAG TPA: hypothetical protein DCQ06_03710, partial [Myxococcales bacterium]|nr:hypothetical protein [Myxococcales bacterium]
CDDGNPCTTDACDAKKGCVASPSKDGVVCAGGGLCKSGACEIGTKDAPGISCLAIRDVLKEQGKSLKSGVYWLKAAKAPAKEAYQAYCEMTVDGGGWTLVIKASGSAKTFVYDSSWWNNNKALAADKADYDNSEAKLASYWTVAFSEVRMGMEYKKVRKWLTIGVKANSLYSVVADGKYRAFTKNAGRSAWKGLISGSTLQKNCNREGFNNRTNLSNHAGIRIGILGNEQSDCSTPDSRIGFGARGDVGGIDKNMPVGSAASYGGDNGNKSVKADFGWIFVR